MKLYFIGTSHGVPEADRRCSCAMLEVNGVLYFVDMGTEVVSDIRRLGKKVEDVRAVFVTPPHNDHTDGLINFASLCSWYYQTAETSVYFPKPGFEELIRGWIGVTESKGHDLKYFVYREGLVYSDENISVTAYKNKHACDSYSFIIEAEGKKLLFTGDITSSKEQPQAVYEMAEKGERLELAVCEAAHISAETACGVYDELKPKRLIFNHAAPHNYQAVENAQKLPHPYELRLSQDGMELEF